MREFIRDEAGHADTGASIAILAVVVVLLVVVLYGAGWFRGFGPRSEPGVDINIRPGS